MYVIKLNDGNNPSSKGERRVAKLYASKAFENVNRALLMQACDKAVDNQHCAMVSACFQPMERKTIVYVTGTTSSQRLSLTQGSRLLSVLFLININHIGNYRDQKFSLVVETAIESMTEITITADDVMLHCRSWSRLQWGLNACVIRASHNEIKINGKKRLFICLTQKEIDDRHLSLTIAKITTKRY